MRRFFVAAFVIIMTISVLACGSTSNDLEETESTVESTTEKNNENRETSDSESTGNSESEDSTETVKDTSVSAMESTKSQETEDESSITIVTSNLQPSEGLQFESNGDGTCNIVGIGTCDDTELVIPNESPEGDTVVLIEEYAFYCLEGVDSVTFLNYNYEVDERAFEYSEMIAVYIIGGSPVIGESAFAGCDKMVSLVFESCELDVDKYAFYNSGKDTDIYFTNCTGSLDDRSFEYGDCVTLTIDGCTLEIGESVFAGCDELASIIFKDSTLELDEYAFYNGGDSTVISIEDCLSEIGDRAFEYSSISEVVISGGKVEIGNSAFAGCEDLSNIEIECAFAMIDEYAFYQCEDLERVSISGDGSSENVISIDDRVFEYCENLIQVIIGTGLIEIGEYCFSYCADDLVINIAGEDYSAEQLERGISS